MTDDRSERLRKRRRRSRRGGNGETPPDEPEPTSEEGFEADGRRPDSAEPDEPAEPAEPSNPSKLSAGDTGDTTDAEPATGDATQSGGAAAHENGDGENGSVKDSQVGTYMYLPKSQTRTLSRVYNVLKAEYEYEFDEPFEKNRHFYPLVVRYGLDQLDGMDAATVRARLEELDR